MKKFLLLSLVQGTLAFVAPTSVVRARVQELQGLPVDEQRSQLRRVSILDTLDSVVLRIPQPVLDGFQFANLAVVLLIASGTDVALEVAVAGVACGAISASAAVFTAFRAPPPPPAAEDAVRAKLKDPYDPPPSNPWTGTNFGQKKVTEYVLDFVTNNAIDTTLVLVDPSGDAKRNLLDPLFRDQIHVVAPTMKKLSLDDDLCLFFGVKDQGIDAFANLIKNGIKFPFGSGLLPAKLIIKVTSTATTEDIVTILSDVNELKEKAGANIIPIVTVESDTFVGALSQSLRSALQVLS